MSCFLEFVAVYGRRRIGKTFLVRETFGDTDEIKLRLRNPALDCAMIMNTKGNAPNLLVVIPGASPNERVMAIGNISGWQICTVFLE